MINVSPQVVEGSQCEDLLEASFYHFLLDFTL